MRIEHLEEFVHLSDSLNFTQTADHFFVTQPVLSRHISGLEHELGIRLFDRVKGRVRLTTAGDSFAKDARRIIDAYWEALENLENRKNGIEESISVGYLLGAGGPFIPRIQKLFSETHPHVEVRYFALEFNEVNEALLNGKVDVAISRPPGNSYDGSIDMRPLYTDEFFAVVPDSHRLASFESVGPEDFRGETIVIPSHQFWQANADGMRSYLSPVLDSIELRGMLYDINSLPLMVQTQGYIGISIGHLRDYYGEGLLFIPLQHCSLEFPVAVAWRRSKMNETLCAYIDVVEEVVGGADFSK